MLECKRREQELVAERKSYQNSKAAVDELIASNLELEDRINDKDESLKISEIAREQLNEDCKGLRAELNKVNDEIANLYEKGILSFLFYEVQMIHKNNFEKIFDFTYA